MSGTWAFEITTVLRAVVRQSRGGQREDEMSTARTDRSGYWFPAKRYGFGWGFPSAWQGWVALLLYVVALAASAYAFPPADNSFGFIVCGIVITAALLAVCWLKGEPPRWRWGK